MFGTNADVIRFLENNLLSEYQELIHLGYSSFDIAQNLQRHIPRELMGPIRGLTRKSGRPAGSISPFPWTPSSPAAALENRGYIRYRFPGFDDYTVQPMRAPTRAELKLIRDEMRSMRKRISSLRRRQSQAQMRRVDRSIKARQAEDAEQYAMITPEEIELNLSRKALPKSVRGAIMQGSIDPDHADLAYALQELREQDNPLYRYIEDLLVYDRGPNEQRLFNALMGNDVIDTRTLAATNVEGMSIGEISELITRGLRKNPKDATDLSQFFRTIVRSDNSDLASSIFDAVLTIRSLPQSVRERIYESDPFLFDLMEPFKAGREINWSPLPVLEREYRAIEDEAMRLYKPGMTKFGDDWWKWRKAVRELRKKRRAYRNAAFSDDDLITSNLRLDPNQEYGSVAAAAIEPDRQRKMLTGEIELEEELLSRRRGFQDLVSRRLLASDMIGPETSVLPAPYVPRGGVYGGSLVEVVGRQIYSQQELATNFSSRTGITGPGILIRPVDFDSQILSAMNVEDINVVQMTGTGMVEPPLRSLQRFVNLDFYQSINERAKVRINYDAANVVEKVEETGRDILRRDSQRISNNIRRLFINQDDLWKNPDLPPILRMVWKDHPDMPKEILEYIWQHTPQKGVPEEVAKLAAARARRVPGSAIISTRDIASELLAGALWEVKSADQIAVSAKDRALNILDEALRGEGPFSESMKAAFTQLLGEDRMSQYLGMNSARNRDRLQTLFQMLQQSVQESDLQIPSTQARALRFFNGALSQSGLDLMRQNVSNVSLQALQEAFTDEEGVVSSAFDNIELVGARMAGEFLGGPEGDVVRSMTVSDLLQRYVSLPRDITSATAKRSADQNMLRAALRRIEAMPIDDDLKQPYLNLVNDLITKYEGVLSDYVPYGELEPNRQQNLLRRTMDYVEKNLPVNSEIRSQWLAYSRKERREFLDYLLREGTIPTQDVTQDLATIMPGVTKAAPEAPLPFETAPEMLRIVENSLGLGTGRKALTKDLADLAAREDFLEALTQSVLRGAGLNVDQLEAYTKMITDNPFVGQKEDVLSRLSQLADNNEGIEFRIDINRALQDLPTESRQTIINELFAGEDAISIQATPSPSSTGFRAIANVDKPIYEVRMQLPDVMTPEQSIATHLGDLLQDVRNRVGTDFGDPQVLQEFLELAREWGMDTAEKRNMMTMYLEYVEDMRQSFGILDDFNSQNALKYFRNYLKKVLRGKIGSKNIENEMELFFAGKIAIRRTKDGKPVFFDMEYLFTEFMGNFGGFRPVAVDSAFPGEPVLTSSFGDVDQLRDIAIKSKSKNPHAVILRMLNAEKGQRAELLTEALNPNSASFTREQSQTVARAWEMLDNSLRRHGIDLDYLEAVSREFLQNEAVDLNGIGGNTHARMIQDLAQFSEEMNIDNPYGPQVVYALSRDMDPRRMYAPLSAGTLIQEADQRNAKTLAMYFDEILSAIQREGDNSPEAVRLIRTISDALANQAKILGQERALRILSDGNFVNLARKISGIKVRGTPLYDDLKATVNAGRKAAEDVLPPVVPPSYTWREGWDILKNEPITKVVGAGAALLAGLGIYRALKHDRTPEDAAGPPYLPGGSFYENPVNVPMSPAMPMTNPLANTGGVDYVVNASGDFDPNELNAQLSSLSGAAPLSTHYYNRLQSPVEQQRAAQRRIISNY